MQERRLRLGEVLDDYCPREKRLTNHVIVALVENEIRQTRCTTCDTEHPYKQGRVPVRRKKADASAVLYTQVLENVTGTGADASTDEVAVPAAQIRVTVPPSVPERVVAPVVLAARPVETIDDTQPEAASDVDADGLAAPREEPVHRHQLIRATLPRIEGQVPERKPADFTMWNVARNAQARRGRRGRPADGAPGYSPFGNGHPNAPVKPAGRPGQGKPTRRNRRGGR
jgi:hypothetical protein